MISRVASLLACLTFAVAAAVAVGAETQGGALGPPGYQLLTSDLMTAFIQPRHVKLWLAGKVRNWEYAAYESHNVGGAFARFAKAVPAYKDQSIAELTAAFVTPAITDLDLAISAKNEAGFQTAYKELTAGCNGCHQATRHEMVVIQVPSSAAFPDQVFAPPVQ